MKRTDIKRYFKLIKHTEALKKLNKEIKTIKPVIEELDLVKARGRILSSTMSSKVNLPDSPHSVFDGYLIHPEDTINASRETPAFLKVVGQVLPGDNPMEFPRGTTVFTATGGAVYNESLALVKVENTYRKDDLVRITFPVNPKHSIAQIGEDIEKDLLLFKKGHTLRPQDIGLLIGLGYRTVSVYKKPIIGILSVGNELITLEDIPEDNKTVNNYAIIVSNLVDEFGGDPKLLGVVPDNLDEIEGKLRAGLNEVDAILTISGCSVGPKDLVPDAINNIGNPGLVFHGITMSPGKVVGAGVMKSKPVVMLPGHIVSLYVGFFLFAVPMIQSLAGYDKTRLQPIIDAEITEEIRVKTLDNFLRVKITKKEDGFYATPLFGGSSRLNSIIGTNGYAIIPAKKKVKKGDKIRVYLYSQRELTNLD